MPKDDVKKFSIFDKKILEHQHRVYKQLKSRMKTWDDLTDDEIIFMYIYHKELFPEETKIAFLKWIGDIKC